MARTLAIFALVKPEDSHETWRLAVFGGLHRPSAVNDENLAGDQGSTQREKPYHFRDLFRSGRLAHQRLLDVALDPILIIRQAASLYRTWSHGVDAHSRRKSARQRFRQTIACGFARRVRNRAVPQSM